MATDNVTGHDPLAVGTVICNGQYRIDKVIKTKGMSRVYKAWDLQLHRYWCIKEVLLDSATIGSKRERAFGEESIKSLRYEYSLMGMLNIPSIPRALNPQQSADGNRIWFPLDWVEGISGKEVIAREVAVPSQTVIKWGCALLETFGYLHQNNIVYRDLKPENLMISDLGKPTEQIHLIDFGIARMITADTQNQGKALGTKGYAPPEQMADNVAFDKRWDLYALGITLFEMVTGVPPVKAEEAQGHNCDFDTFKFSTGVSQGLRDVILKATAKNINDRYQTAEEMLVDMRRIGRFDSDFRRRANTKIWVCRSLVIGGVIVALVAGAGYYLGSRNISGQVNNLAEVAQSSGSFADYKKLAQMDPTNISAYNGMLEALKKGGSVSDKQEKEFTGVLTANLADLKKESGYGDLAYNIGSMYFFYYGDTNSLEGQQEARNWLNDAIKYNAKNKALASDLFVVSDFQSNIQGAMRDGSDAGMYKSSWDAFNEALKGADQAGSDDVVTASLYKSVVDLINNYSYKLAQEGIPQDAVNDMVRQATNFAAKGSDKDATRVTQLKGEIQKVLPSLQDKISISYGVRTK